MPVDDDLLPPGGESARRGIECEFCENALTPAGELKGKLSTRARKFRDAETENDTLREANETLTRQLAESVAALAAAKAVVAPQSNSKRWWED